MKVKINKDLNEIELPYFGKYLCICGTHSSSDTHFELHQIRHISDDITKICSTLMAECKQDDDELRLKCISYTVQLMKITKELVKDCQYPPKDISPIFLDEFEKFKKKLTDNNKSDVL